LENRKISLNIFTPDISADHNGFSGGDLLDLSTKMSIMSLGTGALQAWAAADQLISGENGTKKNRKRLLALLFMVGCVAAICAAGWMFFDMPFEPPPQVVEKFIQKPILVPCPQQATAGITHGDYSPIVGGQSNSVNIGNQMPTPQVPPRISK
jgi:hypothetical protein